VAKNGKQRTRTRKGKGKDVGGRPSKFPGKNRERPIQVYLTDDGLKALDKGTARTSLSRPDYIESLLMAEYRRYDAQA
jgi:hypothetical protein